MNRFDQHIAGRFVMTGAVLLVGLTGCSQVTRPTVQEVRQLLDQQAADWNAGDLDGFLRGYWASPDLTFTAGGVTVRGYDQVVRRYRERYGSGAGMGHLTFSDLEIEGLGDAAAFVFGHWHLELVDGDEPAGVFTVILRRVDGDWVIVHDHTTQVE